MSKNLWKQWRERKAGSDFNLMQQIWSQSHHSWQTFKYWLEKGNDAKDAGPAWVGCYWSSAWQETLYHTWYLSFFYTHAFCCKFNFNRRRYILTKECICVMWVLAGVGCSWLSAWEEASKAFGSAVSQEDSSRTRTAVQICTSSQRREIQTNSIRCVTGRQQLPNYHT